MDTFVKTFQTLLFLIKSESEGKSAFEIVAHESTKTSIEDNQIHLGILQDSRIYEISEPLTKVFALTGNEVKHVKLPFDKLFLDTKINFMGRTIQGILIEGRVKENKPEHYKWTYDIHFVWTDMEREKGEIGVNTIQMYDPDKKTERSINREFKGDICGLVKRFVMNFNDFLEHPEVIISGMTRTNQKARERRGKIPLPSSNIIKVKGELRIYLNSLKPKPGETEDIGKCYEVAGHWRRFRSPRYVHMQGKKIFIHPFVKGTGVPTISRRQVIKSNKVNT